MYKTVKSYLISWWVLLATLLLMVALSTSSNWLTWLGWIAPFDKQNSVYALKNINYENLHPVKAVPVSVPDTEQVTSISMRFKVAALQGYMDLFQTAPGNSGIRAELDPHGALAIVVKGGNQRFSALQLTPNLTLNEWHTLNITVWKKHLIHAKLDARTYNLTDKNIFYELSDITVGAGFSPDRVFQGQIADFAIETKAIDKKYHKLVMNIMHGIVNLLGLVAFFLLISLGKQALDKRSKIEFLSTFVLIGFFVAVVFHYIATYYFGASYPLNTFLFYALGGQFGDFYISLLQDATFAPYTSQVIHAQYFPFTYLLIFPLTKLNAHLALIFYTLFFIFCMFKFFSYYISKKNLTTFAEKLADLKTTFILTLATYPVLFCLERGNLENLIFIFVALAFYFYTQKKRWFTVIFLSMASAMKLYPLFFIIFFVSEKRYFEAIMTMILTVLLTLISLCLFDASFVENLMGWIGALVKLGNFILFLPDSCIHFNLGLWGLIKSLHIYNHLLPTFSLPEIFKWYHMAAFVSLFGIVIYVNFIEKIAWRKLFLIVSAILLLPEISNDYKLLYLFLPLVFFLDEKPSRHDLIYLIIFALILIPKNYYLVSGVVSISSFMNPLLILVIVTSIIGQGVLQTYQRVKHRTLLATPEKLHCQGASQHD